MLHSRCVSNGGLWYEAEFLMIQHRWISAHPPFLHCNFREQWMNGGVTVTGAQPCLGTSFISVFNYVVYKANKLLTLKDYFTFLLGPWERPDLNFPSETLNRKSGRSEVKCSETPRRVHYVEGYHYVVATVSISPASARTYQPLHKLTGVNGHVISHTKIIPISSGMSWDSRWCTACTW